MYMGEYEHLTSAMLDAIDDISCVVKTVGIVLQAGNDKEVAFVGKKLFELGKDLKSSTIFPDMVMEFDDQLTYFGGLIEDCESYDVAESIIEDLKDAYKLGKDTLDEYKQSWVHVAG